MKKKNEKISYISDKLKLGLSCVLVFTSLTGCVTKNSSSNKDNFDDMYEISSAIDIEDKGYEKELDNSLEKVSVSLCYSSVLKNGNLSDRDIEDLNNKCGSGKVEFLVKDENSFDYIPGVSFVVRDSSLNVIDEFTTTDDSYVISGLMLGEVYTIEEVNVPYGYGNPSSIYEFTFEDLENNRKAGNDYYSWTSITIKKEKIEDIILKETGKYNSGRFLVGAVDSNDDYISGVRFLVVNSDNELVAQWVSSNTAHTVTNLSLGKYKVIIEEPPMGYEMESIYDIGTCEYSIDNVISYDFNISSVDDYNGINFCFTPSKSLGNGRLIRCKNKQHF